MWYKAIILLVWLSIPLVASVWLRESYEDYLRECEVQRADCLARAASIRNYTATFENYAKEVGVIDTVEDRMDWERNWASVIRQMQADQLSLRKDPPNHYAATDGLLLAAQATLTRQQDLVKGTVWQRDAYIKAGSGMTELAAQIGNTRMNANYYKRLGAEGIYLQIQDDLARLEDLYNRRRLERSRLNHQIAADLGIANRLHRDILRELGRMDKVLLEDERTTFREELVHRAKGFQLRRELQKLTNGEV